MLVRITKYEKGWPVGFVGRLDGDRVYDTDGTFYFVSTKAYEPVDEPEIVTETVPTKEDHYSKGKIECVDYLYDNLPFESFVGGLEWNVKKYLHRWRNKGQPVKDLRKARDYLNVLIDVTEGKDPEFNEWK